MQLLRVFSVFRGFPPTPSFVFPHVAMSLCPHVAHWRSRSIHITFTLVHANSRYFLLGGRGTPFSQRSTNHLPLNP